MAEKVKHSKLKTYGVLAGIFVLVSLILSVATTTIAYPTQDHKRLAAEFSKLQNKALSDTTMNAMNSPEYKRLRDDPHAKYSDTVNGVGTLVQFVTWLTMIVVSYRYLRKYRLLTHPVRAIAVANATAALLTVIPIELFVRWYAGVRSPFVDGAGMLVVVTIGTTLAGLLMSWLVAKIVEWQYNRSHGFIED